MFDFDIVSKYLQHKKIAIIAWFFGSRYIIGTPKLRIVSVLSIRVTQWHWNLILHVEPSFCPDQQVEHPGMLNRFFLTKSEIAFLWNGKFNCPQIQQKAFGSFLHFIYSSRHLQSRNSCPKVFCKKGDLRNFVIFTGKNL